jgi:ketosteroid isomerase-like protein
MSSNEARATALVRALRAAIERDRGTLGALLTDDVRAWTPTLSTSSLSELLDELERRDDAFSDYVLDATPLDVGGDYACVEWTVAMTNTGRITLDSDHSIEPTGTRVTAHGVTVAEFEGDRICSVRQYWDEKGLLEQLGAATEE